MNQATLKKTATKLPSGPGIYMFKGVGDKDLYIGKASNLKNRVTSYLKTEDVRIKKMLDSARSLKFLHTESDIEALILESQLIKKFRPQFNIVMRDDKQYFYVGFSNENFPKIFITHQPRTSGACPSSVPNFIGPFTDGNTLKSTLRFLRRIFPYCTCKKPHNNFCLNYHIGKCSGFCCLKKPLWITDFASRLSTGLFNPTTYKENIVSIKLVLSGKKRSVIRNLEKEMTQSAKRGNLEKAIELREKLGRLKRVFENAKIIGNWKLKIGNLEVKNSQHNTQYELKQLLKLKQAPVRIEGYDVSNIQGAHATGAMAVFTNGKPDKNQYRKFKIHISIHHDRGVLKDNKLLGDTGMLKEILERRFKHEEWPFPDLILIDGGKGQVNAARAATSKSKFLISKQIQNPKFQIPIIALTKNKKHRGSKIYISDRRTPISLDKLSPADRNLLLAIDSEAHRFAIGYYRKLHRNSLK